LNYTINNDERLLVLEEGGICREIPLYSAQAYEELSRQWMRVGWALGSYYTFTWAGQPLLQLPEDVLRLQEMIFDLKPAAIVETGVCGGGSLLFHATICEAIGKGRVIGIDLHIPESTRTGVSSHRLGQRIAMIEGDSAAPETIAQVRDLVGHDAPVMVILDSDHSRAHVARELEAYAPLVTRGSCIVAEDGVMRDLTDVPGGDPGWITDNPATAAREFLAAHPEFEMREPAWKHNRSQLRRNVTYWPDAWLWRIR
jgi:cephalosporin hydroxylase